MAKKTNIYHIYDNLIAIYGENLLNNYHKILKHISNFINSKSEELQSKNPGLPFVYTKSNENDFYDCCGVEKEVIQKIITESPNVCQINKKQMNPLYGLLMTMISYYTNKSDYFKKLFKGQNYMEPSKLINFYLTLKIYSSARLQQIKYPPNEELMEYVINNLNNRFELALAPNMYTILSRYGESNSSSMNIDFNHISDEDSFKYVDKLNSRLKKFLKNIYEEMLKAKKNNLSSGVQNLDSVNDEGKVYMVDINNISNDIELCTKKVLNTFIQDSSIRKSILKIACDKTKTDMMKMEIMINSIRRSSDSTLLTDMIKNILSYWIMTMRQSVENIHSKKFIIACTNIYTISNTKDVYIIKLKEVLHELLNKYSDLYSSTERKATLSNFKQCVFIYMVLYISTID